jgi:capsular exopolysaccharide synthesis family protein
MVIERALEKMRQAANAPSSVASHANIPTGSAQAERRREQRTDSRVTNKPVFKILPIDRALAEENRVLLPQSAMAEITNAAAAYRMLRTRLLQRLRSNHWVSLAITSPGAAEGKSLTALNLAMSMARDKSCDVFLLDLDMRNPSICRYLGVRPERELLQFFVGGGNPSETLFSIGVENLTLAGSLTPTDQASELIASSRLGELLGYIRSIAQNPVILIDLPPVLVTDEALLVAPRVDATALVVSEGRTRRDGLQRAKQLLADFSFAGIILNRSSESFGADSYYGYGYHYGEAKA